MTRRVKLFRPGKSFPSVSVSGPSCSMACDHCSKKYLGGMADVSKPGALLEFARKLSDRGGKGMLISGGSDKSGAVMYRDHHFREMMEIKRETPLVLNLHTGLITPDIADKISRADVDTVSFDVIGDSETITDVLHLNAAPDDFRQTYKLLTDSGIRVAPHVLAGINYGRLSGEKKAVDLISEFKPDTAVLIILIPTRNTPMENVEPVPESKILDLGRYMKDRLEADLILGCMRPRSYRSLERDLIEMGFSGIVLPRRDTVNWIRARGWDTVEEDACCAIPT
ncbi:MAG: radical SAM protein [Thermoplasmatota archaeon]